jgi:hypothetical protein
MVYFNTKNHNLGYILEGLGMEMLVYILYDHLVYVVTTGICNGHLYMLWPYVYVHNGHLYMYIIAICICNDHLYKHFLICKCNGHLYK